MLDTSIHLVEILPSVPVGVLCLDHSGYVRNEVTHLVEICELRPVQTVELYGIAYSEFMSGPDK